MGSGTSEKKKLSVPALLRKFTGRMPGRGGVAQETVIPFGKELSFGAAEAYRLLRANLLFALPDEKKCRVIGITSANAGEGKTTTAVNLSYMLAEAGQTVMLIESDMRLPTISKRMGLVSTPGLSNLLAGLNSGKEVMRASGVADNFVVIPSGDIPPNPSELLGSEQMKTAIEVFSGMTDFIILDLPPVNEVSDALVASRIVDGLVVVVRQNYTSRRSLSEAMRQIEQANARVLGFVMTDADTLNKWGGYRSKNKKYYKNGDGYRHAYGYGYYSYANSDTQKVNPAFLKSVHSGEDGGANHQNLADLGAGLVADPNPPPESTEEKSVSVSAHGTEMEKG